MQRRQQETTADQSCGGVATNSATTPPTFVIAALRTALLLVYLRRRIASNPPSIITTHVAGSGIGAPTVIIAVESEPHQVANMPRSPSATDPSPLKSASYQVASVRPQFVAIIPRSHRSTWRSIFASPGSMLRIVNDMGNVSPNPVVAIPSIVTASPAGITTWAKSRSAACAVA